MSGAEQVVFKSKKTKSFRQRRKSLEDEQDEDETPTETISKLEETKLKQKLREKPKGVNIIGLAIGQKITIEDEVTKTDPYNVKTGGMVNMKNLKSGKVAPVEDAYDVGIGTQFSAETNKRDEDEEMMKYIEDELSKRKNKKKGESNNKTDNDDSFASQYLSPEDAALMSLPAHLQQSSTQRSEEMLSNQMLNGIPEVDLGIDAKIRNIEATEAAKDQYLYDQKNRKDGPSHFVPTNMAVNFVQHNRFNIENPEQKRQKQQAKELASNTARPGETKPNTLKRATDDYHYDRFKKQFRR